MRKVLPLCLLTALVSESLVAYPAVPTTPGAASNPNAYTSTSNAYTTPYTYSYVQGGTTVTNFYDPNAGPSVSPGLGTTPLDSRLNGPLGQPWQQAQPAAPVYSAPQTVVPIYTGAQPSYVGNPSYGTEPAPNPKPAFVPSSSPPTTQPTTITPIESVNKSELSSPLKTLPGARPPHRNEFLSPIPLPSKDLPLGHVETPTYLFPGLLRQVDNKWVGNDYLYDLPVNIGIVVEIVAPTEVSRTINKEKIKDYIKTIFTSVGIIPASEARGEHPPLPFFHLVAFVIPAQDSFVVNISGRLFEDLKVARLDYKLPGTWQGITWEKQQLLITSRNLLVDQISVAAVEIATFFTERASLSRKQKLQNREELKVHAIPQSPNLHKRGGCCYDD